MEASHIQKTPAGWQTAAFHVRRLLGGLIVTWVSTNPVLTTADGRRSITDAKCHRRFLGGSIRWSHFTRHCHLLPSGFLLLLSASLPEGRRDPKSLPLLFAEELASSLWNPGTGRKGISPSPKGFIKIFFHVKIGPFQNEIGTIYFLSKKYSLSIYYMPGTILDSEVTEANKLRWYNSLKFLQVWLCIIILTCIEGFLYSSHCRVLSMHCLCSAQPPVRYFISMWQMRKLRLKEVNKLSKTQLESNGVQSQSQVHVSQKFTFSSQCAQEAISASSFQLLNTSLGLSNGPRILHSKCS